METKSNMIITDDIKYIGVNDHEIDLFEGHYDVPLGMAYNSYVILDEKVAVLDTMSQGFIDEWLGNLESELKGRQPDYLVIHHLEPDHSAGIFKFMEKYPDAAIVTNEKAFKMILQFFPDIEIKNKVVIKNKDVLELGAHTLHFVFAPMVHWPEVMVSYDSKDKVLFSADGFGKFGANDVEDPEGWDCEARRYYFGIVGKYGKQVQKLLAEAEKLDIEIICALHGPILKGDLGHYLQQYKTWSSYGVESEGVLIAYTSVYGNTKKAVELLAEKLREKGCPKVAVCDLAREDMAECVEDGFRYGKIVLATTTFNGGIFPYMREYIESLVERNYQNRKIAMIENGSWAPTAKKVMTKMLSECENITFTENNLTIVSALTKENEAVLDAMADELLTDSVKTAAEEVKDAPKYVCTVCGYVHEGEITDDFTCPLCMCGAEFFKPAEE